MGFVLAPLVLLVERLVGYPDWLFRRIGHPVTWIGALIAALERGLNRGGGRRAKGVLALLVLLGVTGGVAVALWWTCRLLPFGWVIEVVLATSLIAQKSLDDAVQKVAAGLRVSLDDGRAAVSHIVGRDPQALDEAGVARAAIESLAESTSDGVIAPLFWFLVGGLPGLVLYKAANTADSMTGHKTERYLAFGWAAARFDDLVNLFPARLTAALIAGAAVLVPGASGRDAVRVARRDAAKHESPNAGWPEAAMAGALGFSLGGPRAYEGEVIDLPRFGDGRAELGAGDIDRALRVYRMALNIALGASVVVALSTFGIG